MSMEVRDKQYLHLQFVERIFKNWGFEFESFFANIMQKYYPSGFQKIRPVQDGGNDGYVHESGIYYQVYAPLNSVGTENDAKNKMINDFNKLKSKWDAISKISKYNFVYNDKYIGISHLASARAELESENPGIEFNIIGAHKLENIFFELSSEDMLQLHFDLQTLKVIEIINKQFTQIKHAIFIENFMLARVLLTYLDGIVKELNNNEVFLEYDLLNARLLHKEELVDKSIEQCLSIINRYNNDVRAYLFLAGIYLSISDVENNQKLLSKAEKIDSHYWRYEFENLRRKLHFKESFDYNSFPITNYQNEAKSHFNVLLSQFAIKANDFESAITFISHAVRYNEQKPMNLCVNLEIAWLKKYNENKSLDKLKAKANLTCHLKDIDAIESKIINWTSRTRLFFNFHKFSVNFFLENISSWDKYYFQTLNGVYECYFDNSIDSILSQILSISVLNSTELNKVCEYLIRCRANISKDLSRVLFTQFCYNNSLFSDGERFYSVIQNDHLSLVNLLKSEEYDSFCEIIKDDLGFKVILVYSLGTIPILRRKLINLLPVDDGNFFQERALCLYYLDLGEVDNAYKELQKINFEKISFIECLKLLEIVRKKQSLEFEIKLLDIIIGVEKLNSDNAWEWIFQKFIALLKLRSSLDVCSIGEILLATLPPAIEDGKFEFILANTIEGFLFRGEHSTALSVLTRHSSFKFSSMFILNISVKVYIKNNIPNLALEAIIQGIKLQQKVMPEDYSARYMDLLEITNCVSIQSMPQVINNTFVKLKDKDQWYFIGDDNQLDATLIDVTNRLHQCFIDKNIGTELSLNKFDKISKDTIELVFTYHQYIPHRIMWSFNTLCFENRLEYAAPIRLTQVGDTFDLSPLINIFEERINTTKDFFDSYIKANYPLAILSTVECGLLNAIQRILTNNRGFINSSSGLNDELLQQQSVAKKVIDGYIGYLDATTVFFLIESDMLSKCLKYMPNIKIPNSVLSFLHSWVNKLTNHPSSGGHMAYMDGTLQFYKLDTTSNDILLERFRLSIKLLEASPNNIVYISKANKSSEFMEAEIPAELCDACILAQQDNVAVITEDYLYLNYNALQTGKAIPEYSSSSAIVRELTDRKLIDFIDYMNYHERLTHYRFRFLSVRFQDLEKAVFGDNNVIIFNPENLRKLNLKFVLSKEYGVDFNLMCRIIGDFLFKLITDNSLSLDMVRKIFIELYSSIPGDFNILPKQIMRIILGICRIISQQPRTVILLNQEQRIDFIRELELYLSTI